MLDLDLRLGGRPGDRYSKAGRDFLGHSRVIRYPVAGRIEPARLSDAPERDRVREDEPARPCKGESRGARGNKCTSHPTDPTTPNHTQPTADPIATKVLAVVAEKTGYPEDMLDLDLDLEADLGIDTVKQAETFSAIRESFDIPLQEGLNLRDYPTLQSVIGYVKTNRPDLAGAKAEEQGPTSVLPTQPTQPTGPTQPTQSTADPIAANSPRRRRREDRLSPGHAGSGSRPGGRPGDRYSKAGGNLLRRSASHSISRCRKD